MRAPFWLKLMGLLVLAAGLVWLFNRSGLDITRINPGRVREFVLSFGIWAPVIYLATFGQPLVPLPASIMTAAAGLVFGTAWGAVAALSGATLRASNQFLLVRSLKEEVFHKLFRGKVPVLYRTTGQFGFKSVLLVRLIPNFPFDIQNYGLAFTPVRFTPYLLATVAGILPGTIIGVYFGHALTDPKRLWKVVMVMLVIVALAVLQRVWAARQRAVPSLVPAPKP